MDNYLRLELESIPGSDTLANKALDSVVKHAAAKLLEHYGRVHAFFDGCEGKPSKERRARVRSLLCKYISRHTSGKYQK
jgi:hypothetical protein